MNNDRSQGNALSFLSQNSYGLLFGDDEAGEYEFIWAGSPKEIFERAYEMVVDAKLAYIEYEGGAELDPEGRDALDKARVNFERDGLTEETLAYLMSIDPYGDRAGISWWGSFEQLKTSEGVWPRQTRRSFRGNSDESPIKEETEFASYLTREPFEW